MGFYPPPSISLSQGAYMTPPNIPPNLPSNMIHGYYPGYPPISPMMAMPSNMPLGARPPYGVYPVPPAIHSLPPNPYSSPYGYQNLGMYSYGGQNPAFNSTG
jgi:hypothetical protein